MKAVFTGKARNGKMAWFNPAQVRNFFKQVEGKNLTITIDEVRKKRSINQNSYWWGVVCTMLAEYTGHTKEEINSLIEAMYLSEEVYIQEKGYVVSRHVKTLSTVEFNELKLKVQEWAALEFDLNIPDPDEDFFIM